MSILNKEPIISKDNAVSLDKKAVEINNIPSIILMEEASGKISEQIIKDFPDIIEQKIVILSGIGNNGGDSLSLARRLIFYGNKPDIFLLSDKKGSRLFETQKSILSSLGVNFKSISLLNKSLKNYTLLVDGLFGIGYSYRKNADLDSLFDLINSSNIKTVSIDTPSGLNPDGHKSITADITYSVGFLKDYFFNISSRKYLGDIKDLKISFDLKNIGFTNKYYYINKIDEIKRKKDKFVHKYNKGSCITIGGDAGKFGSVIFASKSALRIGAGISLVITDKENVVPINKMSEEIIVDEFKNIYNHINKYKSVIIGPGLGIKNSSDIKYVISILKEDKSFLFDASFFSVFKKDNLKYLKNPPLLTPHTQELINFFGDEAQDIKNNTIYVVSKLAKKYKCYLLLKDTFFVFSTPDGESYIIDKPMRILAQAGSGDILTGIIGGLLSQGYSTFDSVFEGIRVFHNIAEKLSNKNYQSYVANEFIDNIEFFK